MYDPTRFKALLESQYQWPTVYQFKFICGREQLEALKALLGPKVQLQIKESAQGKYVAVTFSRHMECSSDVIEVYQRVAVISGVIAL
jgi:putative lipoic acid-binding regulatory protein